MLITHAEPFQQGLEAVIDRNGPDGDVLMDFGVLTLAAGQTWISGPADEKALLLMSGAVDLEWSSARTGEAGRASAARSSLFDQDPAVLHVPDGFEVAVTAGAGGAELTVSRTANPRPFPARFYTPADCRSEERGKGTMRETSTRIVRTVFDDSNAPQANLVIGEVVTAPGKWSSYPPHHHPQPEIYHYRFLPEQGFGLTAIGQETHTLRHRDTVVIRDTQDHPQVAAPGYAMWYVWIIRHLDGNRYSGPTFTPEHTWVQDPAAAIWAPPSER
jgi:5-deoxy-glucuronate isomerase